MSEREPDAAGSNRPRLSSKRTRYAYVALLAILVVWFFFGRDWFIELGALAAAGFIGWRRPTSFALSRESGFVALAGIAVALLVFLGWNESWYRLASAVAWSGIGLALGSIVRRGNLGGSGWFGRFKRPAVKNEKASFREKFDADLERQRSDR